MNLNILQNIQTNGLCRTHIASQASLSPISMIHVLTTFKLAEMEKPNRVGNFLCLQCEFGIAFIGPNSEQTTLNSQNVQIYHI